MINEAIGYNQLQYFVYMNLLTGLFNLVSQTYLLSVFASIFCMLLYYFTCAIIVNNCKKCKCWQHIL